MMINDISYGDDQYSEQYEMENFAVEKPSTTVSASVDSDPDPIEPLNHPDEESSSPSPQPKTTTVQPFTSATDMTKTPSSNKSNEYQRPPPKEIRLSDEDRKILRKWISSQQTNGQMLKNGIYISCQQLNGQLTELRFIYGKFLCERYPDNQRCVNLRYRRADMIKLISEYCGGYQLRNLNSNQPNCNELLDTFISLIVVFRTIQCTEQSTTAKCMDIREKIYEFIHQSGQNCIQEKVYCKDITI
ncbi:hypothetical protein BLA29_009863, partial [Euroglyphus maynei]